MHRKGHITSWQKTEHSSLRPGNYLRGSLQAFQGCNSRYLRASLSKRNTRMAILVCLPLTSTSRGISCMRLSLSYQNRVKTSGRKGALLVENRESSSSSLWLGLNCARLPTTAPTMVRTASGASSSLASLQICLSSGSNCLARRFRSPLVVQQEIDWNLALTHLILNPRLSLISRLIRTKQRTWTTLALNRLPPKCRFLVFLEVLLSKEKHGLFPTDSNRLVRDYRRRGSWSRRGARGSGRMQQRLDGVLGDQRFYFPSLLSLVRCRRSRCSTLSWSGLRQTCRSSLAQEQTLIIICMIPPSSSTRVIRSIFLGYPGHWHVLAYCLLSWAFGALLFAGWAAPRLPLPQLNIVIAFLFGLLGCGFGVLSWTTPAGMVQGRQLQPQQAERLCANLNSESNSRIESYRYCSTCRLVRPPLSSHCRYCNHCVSQFDHHCAFIANCVGECNWPYFAGMTVSLWAGSLYGLLSVAWLLVRQAASDECQLRFSLSDYLVLSAAVAVIAGRGCSLSGLAAVLVVAVKMAKSAAGTWFLASLHSNWHFWLLMAAALGNALYIWEGFQNAVMRMASGRTLKQRK